MSNFSILRPLVLTAALSFGVLSTAAAVQYTSIDAEASKISFGYSQMNVNMDGRFTKIKATKFSFDPAKPEAAQVAIEIPLATIDAGYAEANTELEKDEWLNLAAHPFASFVSSKVEALGDNRYQVTGTLSIKGKAKETTAPFTFHQDENAGIFEGSFIFQRADFGVGEGQWKDFSIVANDIQIKFRVVANP